MKRKERLANLDNILRFLRNKSLDENPVWHLDKIDFLEHHNKLTLIELQSCLIKDGYVAAPTVSLSKPVPLKINSSGVEFITKGGYLAVWRKERNERLKSTIILTGVLFSILLGIVTTTLSVINYQESKNKQNKKLEDLQKQFDMFKLENNLLKNKMSTDSIKIK